MDPELVLSRLEEREALDRVGARLEPLARRIVGEGRRRDLLSGTPLGHPAHPMAVMAPISCFMSASILDLVGGRGGRRAARRLLGVGVVTALPAAAAGLSDWIDTDRAERRVGTVHAAANTAALALYGLSWRRRRQGRWAQGVATALAGTALTGAAGFLGGHLTYRRGVGVDTTAFQSGPRQWRAVARAEDLPDGRPAEVEADGVPLVALRHGTAVGVLEARCTHRGGPLTEGTARDGCITCPWHGSTFDVHDGRVVTGPASAPAPAYEVHQVAGTVEVRRPEPGSLRLVERRGPGPQSE